jgi:hypothetical protein
MIGWEPTENSLFSQEGVPRVSGDLRGLNRYGKDGRQKNDE